MAIFYVDGYVDTMLQCYRIGGDNVRTEAQKKASIKWNSSRDNIMIRPDKETGAQIRQAAADAGQSVQQYILQAVNDRMKTEV